ncbi:MAG: hypothetical protein ACKVT1_05025 [Dehalococcoidia bacterium]
MLRRTAVAAFALAAVLAVACEKPDPSFQTSPSAKALVGTSTGNVAYGPADSPPPQIADPEGWQVRFELALFDHVENGTQSLRVVLQAKTKKGAGMEVWLANEQGTVARWSGGSTDIYDGVVCFQMKLREAGESLSLPPGEYTATLVFRDVERGPIVVNQQPVRGTVPKLTGSAPAERSPVFRDLLGCPRGT